MQMTNLFENSFQTPIVKRFEATSCSSSFESTRIETRIAIESSQTMIAIVESVFCYYIEKNWKKFHSEIQKLKRNLVSTTLASNFNIFWSSLQIVLLQFLSILTWIEAILTKCNFIVSSGWRPLDKDELSLSALKHSLVIFDFIDPVALWPSGKRIL